MRSRLMLVSRAPAAAYTAPVSVIPRCCRCPLLRNEVWSRLRMIPLLSLSHLQVTPNKKAAMLESEDALVKRPLLFKGARSSPTDSFKRPAPARLSRTSRLVTATSALALDAPAAPPMTRTCRRRPCPCAPAFRSPRSSARVRHSRPCCSRATVVAHPNRAWAAGVTGGAAQGPRAKDCRMRCVRVSGTTPPPYAMRDRMRRPAGRGRPRLAPDARPRDAAGGRRPAWRRRRCVATDDLRIATAPLA